VLTLLPLGWWVHCWSRRRKKGVGETDRVG
jgi:hypothetical protein